MLHSHSPQAASERESAERVESNTFSHNPSLRSGQALPTQPTPLVGREREVAEVASMLRRREVRLLTLVGPPGIGKTRLGLQVAADLLDDFPDGVCFVPLAPISDPNLVASAMTQALDVREVSNRPLVESLKSYLQSTEMLLLADNFEQVITAGPLLADLLAACPGVKLLVTSRELLHLHGEYDYPVPPLPLPDLNILPDLKALSQCEAIALFVQRAQAVSPSFQLTQHNAVSVAEISLRLDGLPLAIELAAARILVLPPQELLARLASRLKLLTGGARDLPERHRTLQAAIDWSYGLLDEGEQTLFRRLGVFVGGCTLNAIEEVCGTDLTIDTLDGITFLVSKSLLQRQEGRGMSEAGGEPRFMMLETIREYARERLQQSEEAEEVSRRHAQYFLELAEESMPQLKGPQQVEWLDRLEKDHNNLRATLDWCESTTSEHASETALRLARALSGFWEVRGYLTEGREWLTRVLSLKASSLPSAADEDERKAVQRARAGALNGAARLAFFQGDYKVARRLSEESVALSRQLGAGDKANVASALSNLGHVLIQQGDLIGAHSAHEESLAIRTELGDKASVAASLTNVGLVAAHRGDYDRAGTLLEEGLTLYHELGDKEGRAYSLRHLGFTAHSQGDYEQARALLKTSLILFWEQGNKRVVAECLTELAAITGAQGQPKVAARLFGAAQALYEALGTAMWDANRPLFERDLATTRAQLDEEDWQKAWQEGRAMTIQEAVAYALEPSSERMSTGLPVRTGTPAERESPYPDDLTEREVEVLRLIASGKSNQEIASELVLSLRTVERHISNIYQKIGATGRVARATATVYALKHGLAHAD